MVQPPIQLFVKVKQLKKYILKYRSSKNISINLLLFGRTEFSENS